MKNLDEMWTRIGSTKKEEVVLAVLKDEIVLATSRLEPHDTGHLHDYIARLNNRIEEIETQDPKIYFQHEQVATTVDK